MLLDRNSEEFTSLNLITLQGNPNTQIEKVKLTSAQNIRFVTFSLGQILLKFDSKLVGTYKHIKILTSSSFLLKE